MTHEKCGWQSSLGIIVVNLLGVFIIMAIKIHSDKFQFGLIFATFMHVSHSYAHFVTLVAFNIIRCAHSYHTYKPLIMVAFVGVVVVIFFFPFHLLYLTGHCVIGLRFVVDTRVGACVYRIRLRLTGQYRSRFEVIQA